MPDSPEVALAEIAYAGEWRIEPATSSRTLTLTLEYPPSASRCGGPIVPERVGLAAADLAGPAHGVRFELRRDAGTFACRGTAGDGRAAGAFRFSPDPAYASAIMNIGMGPLTLRDHIVAGLFDLSASFVNAIVESWGGPVPFSQLISLKVSRVPAERFTGLHAEFPAERFDDIASFAMRGGDAAYVDALRRAGIGDLSALNVAAWLASGVDRAFVERLAATGTRCRSIDEIASLHRDRS